MVSFFSANKEKRQAERALRKKVSEANRELLRFIHMIPERLTESERETIRTLVQDGADINVQGSGHGYDGVTLLHAAAVEDDYETIKLLIELGADINAATPEMGSVLNTIIVCTGNIEIVSYLVNAGARITFFDISMARQMKHEEIAVFLESRKQNQ